MTRAFDVYEIRIAGGIPKKEFANLTLWGTIQRFIAFTQHHCSDVVTHFGIYLFIYNNAAHLLAQTYVRLQFS